MMTLTEKEKMVLTAIISESDFNFNHLDITKDWEEQRLENGESYWCFASVKDYGCGMDKQAVRGVFGSLHKKGLIDFDDSYGTDWIVIYEENFRRIKEVLQ